MSLSFTMLGDGRQLRDDQLALDLRQVTDVPQPEGDQDLARRLEEIRPTGRFFPPGDADEPPLEEVVEHRLGVHTTNRVDLGTRHRLLVGDDRQRLERRPREAGARPGAGQPDEPRGHLGPCDHPVSAADLDDLQALAGCLVARAQLLDQPARLVDVGQIEHLADALGFQRRIGREEKCFDDVSWSRHGLAPHWVPRSGVR